MKKIIYISLIFILALPMAPGSWAAQREHERLRQQALKAFNDGNWKDAYQIYRRLCLEVENDPKIVGNDLIQAWQCLRNLNRLNELDAFREAVIEKHVNNWRLLRAAAGSYSQNNHWGYMVAGEFHRGHHRGGGRYVNAIQRDRVRTLQLMNRGLELSAADPARHEVANFCLEFAQILIQYSGYQQSWRLQYLTDLKTLPDYESGHGYGYGSSTRGAPVDSNGEPVFHRVASSFEAAKSDGERWRWLMVEAARLNPGLDAHVKFLFASFLHQQFGVQTLSAYRHFFAGYGSFSERDSIGEQTSQYQVHTLTDSETLAKLANGVKRFELPAEFNFIQLFNEIASEPNKGYGNNAIRTLAHIYENRRLYDRALEYWIRYKKYNARESDQHIDQITKNWGIFEPTGTQPAGRLPTVEYRFRNGSQINFKAYQIRIDRLLGDVKSYIQSNPWRLDRSKVRIDDIGWRLVHENQTKYIGREVADWNLALDPDKRHWDRRITVELPGPLDKPGAYLLIGKIRDGNTARIVIWVSDTTLVKKPLNNQVLYYAADAVNGRPLGDTKVEFFGYRTKRIRGTNRYQVDYTDFHRNTDEQGRIILNPADMKNNYSWLATVSTDNRLAYLGFSSVWYPNYYDREYNQIKTFVMTDRPVYRPKQKVRFKLWVRQAKYDRADASIYAGQSFSVKIHNPKNEEIFAQQIMADAHGGLEGEYDIPVDASLGVYRIFHGSGSVHGGNTFRVEEYKKPEFEVKVDAPEVPVMLGEKITATIRADYYFGSPVTEATVKYKVYRAEYDDRWYPTYYWDWFYGPGYWWYGYDYSWYPGWRQWGCRRPLYSWWPRWSRQPPEVVAEGEVKIGRDGTVRVEIDTELTKLIHGDKDHRYTISAEVRDQSRRTIVGQGQVLVARRPFKVYAWVDRGHYRIGESIQASFKAQTLDQKPVQGKGVLKLLKITYRDNEPQESEVGRWKLDTDDRGQALIQLQASRAGQYRLSYQVTDSKKHVIEGGYIFTIRGEEDDGAQYRFSKIELVPDKSEYAPGDRVRLQINTDREGAAVVLFVRPANGIYLPPDIISMTGKSAIVDIAVTRKDMPNFYVEALSVYDGKLYSEVREIVVPPQKRVLNVAIQPSQKAYRPGQKANFKINITNYDGEPFQGTAVMTVYDRALEYISGGSNVPEIRSFFWKWRRQHQSQTQSSLARRFYNLLRKKEEAMRNIGVFGHLMFQDVSDDEGTEADQVVAEAAPETAMAPAAAESKLAGRSLVAKAKKADRFDAANGEPGAPENLVQPTVRTKFADTAFWSGTILADSSGTAEINFTMPENLTGWKAMVWSMGHGTKVGQGSVEVVTRKDLILRLQAPRFFVETDEVVLSA
ncbi:MAG: MG2 domain-containing protein, partial [Desulfobacterales bacterium]|nr:MG2 domain-containing protein [Desulfobacterales bacterium]